MVIYGFMVINGDLMVMNGNVSKQCHKPPMTGNGNHTTYQTGDLEDGSSLFYPHSCIKLKGLINGEYIYMVNCLVVSTYPSEK